jgi:hypothetical protein
MSAFVQGSTSPSRFNARLLCDICTRNAKTAPAWGSAEAVKPLGEVSPRNWGGGSGEQRMI